MTCRIEGSLGAKSAMVLVVVFAASVVPVVLAQHESMPPGMSHEEHLRQMRQKAELDQRGGLAMGFDQDKATHHFVLTGTGGYIEVLVNTSTAETTRKQVRDHLKKISQEFADGVFTSPIATHAEVPAGVPVLQNRRALIQYSYAETKTGARVTITTKDRATLRALHDFLRYQIREHATGDSAAVQK